MFASNEIDQDAGEGSIVEWRSTDKDRTTSITSVMSRKLVVDWNIKGKKGGWRKMKLVGEDGGKSGWREWGKQKTRTTE